MNAVASRNIKFVGHSDLGGRGDGVQIMVHRGYAYIGHGFSNGITTSTCATRRARRSSISSRARPARAPFTCRPMTISCWRSTRRASGPCRNFRTRRLISADRRPTSSRTEQVYRRHPGLRYFQAGETGRDRLHAGRRHRAAPDLVHRRPLRLCLDPLRRFHRPHPRRHRHVQPAQARGRRPLVAPRHVARRRRNAELAEGKRYALHHALIAGNMPMPPGATGA